MVDGWVVAGRLTAKSANGPLPELCPEPEFRSSSIMIVNHNDLDRWEAAIAVSFHPRLLDSVADSRVFPRIVPGHGLAADHILNRQADRVV